MVTDAQPHASHDSRPIRLDMHSTGELEHEDVVDLTGNDQVRLWPMANPCTQLYICGLHEW